MVVRLASTVVSGCIYTRLGGPCAVVVVVDADADASAVADVTAAAVGAVVVVVVTGAVHGASKGAMCTLSLGEARMRGR